jgi:non-specific serine/threonine protein kinase
VSERVARAVARALAKRPEARYGSARELAEALGSAGVAAAGDQRASWAALQATVVLGHATTEPPVNTAATRPLPCDNLPRPITRFVGREGQVQDVGRLLGTERLVSLVGPGGIGKTRLALEAARGAMGEYPDGVWLVDLTALADPSLVPQAVAAALEVREEGGRPITDTLATWLRGKRALLLLDNCEHLVDACARLAEHLVAACAGLRVLVTSREVLGVAGEAVWHVPALAVPAAGAGPDEALASEAVRLFVDRAALSKPGFVAEEGNAPTLAAVCRRLEGIPLAIELAAARVRALSLEQILARLDDRFRLLTGGGRTAPSRQRTLRATLDWSFEFLTSEERVLLRRLAVFAGGATLSAAEAVCGGGELEVLDGLGSLVDKSLLRQREQEDGEARFLMLEVVREFALEQLEAHAEARAARLAHAHYFLRLAEGAAPELAGGRQAEWLARLESEHDNLRAALLWLLEHDADASLRLATATRNLWFLHGHFTEGRQWLDAALRRSRTAPAPVRHWALAGAGNMARLQGDLEAARAYFEEDLHLSRTTGDALLIGQASNNLGILALNQGDLQTARANFEEGLARGREVGNNQLITLSMNQLGEIARAEGEWAEARKIYEQAVARFRQAGNPLHVNVSTALTNLGAVACEAGDLGGSGAAYREALTIDRRLGNREGMSYSLDGLGAVAAGRGAWERAARLGGAAEALREEIGAVLEPLEQRTHDGWVGRLREALDPATLDREWACGRAMDLAEAVREALEEAEG